MREEKNTKKLFFFFTNTHKQRGLFSFLFGFVHIYQFI